MSAVETKCKQGDTVRIARQPPNQHVSVRGEVGEVDELESLDGVEYARIQTYRLETLSIGGCGSVPVDCLEPHKDPRLDAAIAAWRAERAAALAAGERRVKRWEDLVAKLAGKHGLAPAVVEEIMSAGRNFE